MSYLKKTTFLKIFLILFLLSAADCGDGKMDQKFPWPEKTTEKALEAIRISIKNLKLPRQQRDKNFPADPGPYNVPFTQKKIEQFAITGYTHSTAEPHVYRIEFKPKENEHSGNRITVEINIKTNTAVRVYMQPDA